MNIELRLPDFTERRTTWDFQSSYFVLTTSTKYNSWI